MKKAKIKTWYTSKLPSGEITALTLDEAKAEVDRYLRGEYFSFYDSNYIMVTDKVSIYKHTFKGEITIECMREYCENDERDVELIGIDYGVLGFMTEWKV